MTVFTMLYTRSSQWIRLITETLSPFVTSPYFSIFYQPPPHNTVPETTIHSLYLWLFKEILHVSERFSSVAQAYWTLCNPMDRSTSGFPVHHWHPELTQTHAHWVGNATQPSHPLSCHSAPAFSLSQHQCLFKWVSSSHQVPKVQEFQLQHQSFQWILRIHLLTVQGLSRIFSDTMVQKHQFFSAQFSL